MNLNTWIDARVILCAQSPVVRFPSSWSAHLIVAQGSSCARLSCHPYMQWALLFDFELSIPSNFLFPSFIFNLLQSLLHFFHYLEDSSNTAYSAIKEMGPTDESYLPTVRTPWNLRRSQEQTERQERCARGDAWRLAKNISKLKEKDKATFFSPTNEWCLQAPSVIKTEGKRNRCRFRSIHAHVERERRELWRIGI